MDVDEEMKELDARTKTIEVELTKEEVEKFELSIGDYSVPKRKPPVFYDDAIMNYLRIKDKPDCYEKKIKKLRCLLWF
jgi:hypothetical protein